MLKFVAKMELGMIASFLMNFTRYFERTCLASPVQFMPIINISKVVSLLCAADWKNCLPPSYHRWFWVSVWIQRFSSGLERDKTETETGRTLLISNTKSLLLRDDSSGGTGTWLSSLLLEKDRYRYMVLDLDYYMATSWNLVYLLVRLCAICLVTCLL